MSKITDSPPVFLDVFFNSKGQHSPYAIETPEVDGSLGFSVPWKDQAQAYRSWRSEWGVVDPNPDIEQTPLWQPGLRVVQVEASQNIPGYSAVGGKMMAIRFWDLAPETLTPEAADDTEVTYWLEFAAQYCSEPGDSHVLDPRVVLPTYIGLDGKAHEMTEVKRGLNGSICCTVSETVGHAMPAPRLVSRFHAAQKVTNTVHVRFADFGAAYEKGAIRIFIAAFAQVITNGKSTYFYDDPEMDVNVP